MSIAYERTKIYVGLELWIIYTKPINLAVVSTLVDTKIDRLR